jgi:ABC-2 type transport system permease protein
VSKLWGSFGAEWLKLRKRTSTWILGGILVLLVLVLEYGFALLAITTVPKGTHLGGGVTLAGLREALYPAHFTQMTLSGFVSGVGSAIALILGVLLYGSEYTWSTLKTVFTQRPGRLHVLGGKLGALALTLLIYTLATFAATAILSSVVQAAYGGTSAWPGAGDVARAVLVAWLISGLWATLGMVLSVLFRQSALAIGLGLVYAIAVETIVFNVLRGFSWMQNVERGFPGANAQALAQSFGSAVRSATEPAALVGAGQAAAVVAAFLVAFTVLSALLLRRDVT